MTILEQPIKPALFSSVPGRNIGIDKNRTRAPAINYRAQNINERLFIGARVIIDRVIREQCKRKNPNPAPGYFEQLRVFKRENRQLDNPKI